MIHTLSVCGTAVAQWLRCCATNRKVAGSIPAGVSGFFIDLKSFRSHYGTGVDSASNRNEYQVYILGVKGGRCVRLTTLPPSCAIVTKSVNLNFLEPSGPVQVCNGTALPSPYMPKISLRSTFTFRYCTYFANSRTGVGFRELFQFRKGFHKQQVLKSTAVKKHNKIWHLKQ